MTSSEQKQKRKDNRKGKKYWKDLTPLTALEICMIAIQLALCVQLGTLCIQLSHLYSAPKLLENASFKLEPHYECLFSPGFKKKRGEQWGGEERKKSSTKGKKETRSKKERKGMGIE